MLDTVTAFGVSLLAVLPGGLYIWSFERVVGRWGIGLSDRLLRLVATSAVFLSVLAYPAYLLWSEYLHQKSVMDGKPIFVNRIAEGESLPWWLYVLPVADVALPFVPGTSRGEP
jgi:hypothetical protein